MDNNLLEFDLALENFKKKIPEEFRKFQKMVVLDAMKRIIFKSPVDTGRFRANWNTAIGAPDESTTENTDPSGSEAQARCLDVLDGLDPYDTVYLTNNLDYAMALEHGHSQQAPGGMIALTVVELQTLIGGMK